MVLRVRGDNNLWGQNQFAANVSIMEKPGTRFALVKCVCKVDILNRDTGN